MSLKDYLGLYQEINVQTHAEANSIKQELYNIQAPSIKVGNDGWVTRCYFWTLGEFRAISLGIEKNISVAQLICLTMIGALTAFQACTNIVI